ncbi:MAG: sigma-54 dependent transcriptional regulator [Myxococcota bacterium]|nr:sigma-54 dependent transcriptional regulator [Myxococcota bacterium]
MKLKLGFGDYRAVGFCLLAEKRRMVFTPRMSFESENTRNKFTPMAKVCSPGVLYVDDESSNTEMFKLQFGRFFRVFVANSADEGLRLLEELSIAVVITDIRMPGMTGVEFLAVVANKWPEIGRLVLSAYSDSDILMNAINEGQAEEYILKPWRAEELRLRLDHACKKAEHRLELSLKAEREAAMRRDQEVAHRAFEMVGEEGGLAELLEQTRRAAKSESSILIRGETGTGKELLARFLHESSPRNDGPFIALNCAAIADNLLQSELFGHEKGAFTGANSMRRGRFELANGGTIFLDEIGDISQGVQVALLRVLQEKTIERLGGHQSIPLNVRVLAATHRDLEARVASGDFREDLYFRLNVVDLEIPPLRKRSGDILELANFFIRKYSPKGKESPTLTEASADALIHYEWPGNVRELENIVQRALVLNQDVKKLDLDAFTFNFRLVQRMNEAWGIQSPESESIRRALRVSGGNWTRAARALAIPRTTLISRAKKLGIG